MRPFTAIRVTGALVVVPLCFAMSAFISLTEWEGRAYGVVELASASFQVAYTGPLTAGYLAFAFARHTRPLVDERPSRRGLSLALLPWAWLMVGAPVAGILAMVAVTRVVPRTRSELAIVGVTLLAGLACSMFGAMTSRATHPVVAVPLAALGSFAFLALPATGLDVLLRNINSDFSGCCTPETQPATAMMVASAVLTGVLVIAGLLTFIPSNWRRQSRPLVVGALLGSLLLAGVTAAQTADHVGDPLTLLAVQPRTDSMRCLQRDSLEACVWPENGAHLDQLLTEYQDFRRRLEAGGLSTWPRVSEDPRDRSSALATVQKPFVLRDLTYILVAVYALHAPACGTAGGPPSSDLATAWIGLLAGMTARELSPRLLHPEILDEAGDQIAHGPGGAEQRFASLVCRPDGA